MSTFGIIVVAGTLICGLLMVTGHGDFLMNAGTPADRKKIYDDRKVEKASGIAFLVTAVISAIDLFTTSLACKIAYLAAIIVIFGVLLWYIVNKCKLQ